MATPGIVILVCIVCLCPIKRTLGVYGLNINIFFYFMQKLAEYRLTLFQITYIKFALDIFAYLLRKRDVVA